MSINAANSFNSALTLWGSLYQDMNSIDLPEGLSPANEDMWYVPGSVQTRPGLSKFLGVHIAGNPTIMSVYDFPLPSGDFAATFLDSLGALRQKLASTGAVTQTDTVSPGVQFKAENAFNKQFYAFYGQELSAAFSDSPFVGVDVPRYNDSKGNVWRVTQDAPGQPPAAADYIVTSPIAGAGVPGLQIITEAVTGDAIEEGALVTITYAGTFVVKPQVGDIVVTTGFGVAGYNGTFVLTAVTNHTLQYVAAVTGLAPSLAGTATVSFIEVTLSAAGTYQAGDLIAIAGAALATYDGTYTIRRRNSSTIYILGAMIGQLALGVSGGGTFSIAGHIAAGNRQGVLMFQSFEGAITAPSIPFFWTAAGNVPVSLQQIPTGPPGTKQRILAFTPSGGSNFYYIPPSLIPSSTGGQPTITQGTIIADNTSTSVIIDFSDQALIAGIQIDIEGNNLFNQIVLAPCLGVIEYQSRLCWWGEINNIKNFLNMGFDGGFLASNPTGLILGWSNEYSSGGTTAPTLTGNPDMGYACSMASAGGIIDCAISQGAYQDYYGAPILQPNTQYLWRFQALRGLTATAGTLTCDIFSPSGGVIATASLLVSSISTATFTWHVVSFDNRLPAAIPADTVLRVYLDGVPAGGVVVTDELEIIDAEQPVLAQQMRASYVANEFGYDSVTGIIGFDTVESITAAFRQRGYLYVNTDRSLFLTQNNGSTEPFLWTTSQFAQVCGCSSPAAVDSGEGVSAWVGRYGRFIFSGDTPKKISQELQPTFDRINWDVETRIWLVNDPVERILHTGLPLDDATAPSIVQPVSYRSVDSAYNIPDPLFTMKGRLMAGDLSRKSTIWNVKANCGAMVTQPLGSQGPASQMIFGGGNGQAPNLAPAFGNLYTLDFAKFTDDDYGRIGGLTGNYYTTYCYWSEEIEQSVPELGLHRKFYAFLSAYVTGIGNIQITPYVDSLNNPVRPLRPYGLTQGTLKHDLEWGLNFTGDRAFFKIKPVPLQVSTITNVSIVDNILTIRANIALGPTNYSVGQSYTLAGLTHATFLNGQTITLLSVSAVGFTAAFTHADYLSAPDTGTCSPLSVTDAFMNINHLVLAGRMDRIFPVRGSYLSA